MFLIVCTGLKHIAYCVLDTQAYFKFKPIFFLCDLEVLMINFGSISFFFRFFLMLQFVIVLRCRTTFTWLVISETNMVVIVSECPTIPKDCFALNVLLVSNQCIKASFLDFIEFHVFIVSVYFS